MHPKVPLFAGIFLAAGLVELFAVTSWKSQPWGLASFILAVVMLVGSGAALYLMLQRKHQSR